MAIQPSRQAAAWSAWDGALVWAIDARHLTSDNQALTDKLAAARSNARRIADLELRLLDTPSLPRTRGSFSVFLLLGPRSAVAPRVRGIIPRRPSWWRRCWCRSAYAEIVPNAGIMPSESPRCLSRQPHRRPVAGHRPALRTRTERPRRDVAPARHRLPVESAANQPISASGEPCDEQHPPGAPAPTAPQAAARQLPAGHPAAQRYPRQTEAAPLQLRRPASQERPTPGDRRRTPPDLDLPCRSPATGRGRLPTTRSVSAVRPRRTPPSRTRPQPAARPHSTPSPTGELSDGRKFGG
ncbi:hypothetical protein EV192_104249 [Actinocrispum wychmicini]|uniref:Uncharacterized protein n=1 Tax=Actinocrispum wychmicini TaxID=1213861 RepID=A0A4R2JQF2_9PSEU|nr:hypothetical protein EV192_104249 [Actinocrispum wychmicini]